MDVIDIYKDVKDALNTPENGTLTFAMFNRASKKAERRLIDFLTGDVENQRVPAPYLSQKNKDWVSFLITDHSEFLSEGVLSKPKDYYQFENLYAVVGKRENCDEDIKIKRYSVELLNGSQFNERIDTSIEELRVENKPIAKLTGKGFVFAPKDVGNAVGAGLISFVDIEGQVAMKLNNKWTGVKDVPSSYSVQEKESRFIDFLSRPEGASLRIDIEKDLLKSEGASTVKEKAVVVDSNGDGKEVVDNDTKVLVDDSKTTRKPRATTGKGK